MMMLHVFSRHPLKYVSALSAGKFSPVAGEYSGMPIFVVLRILHSVSSSTPFYIGAVAKISPVYATLLVDASSQQVYAH